ncbi:hypothetical protein XHV734_3535 [Xanthomonas hortorum pv. vitians]|nr:hypothetical protein XHV734_3535 [Xanthomonas hortorum pv. vitians]
MAHSIVCSGSNGISHFRALRKSKILTLVEPCQSRGVQSVWALFALQVRCRAQDIARHTIAY